MYIYMFVYIIHMYTHIHKDAQRYTYTQFENSSLLLEYKNMPDAETCLESVSLETAFIWHRGLLAETGNFFCVGPEFHEILAGGEWLTSLQISPKPLPATLPDVPPSVDLHRRCILFASHSTGRNVSGIFWVCFNNPKRNPGVQMCSWH